MTHRHSGPARLIAAAAVLAVAATPCLAARKEVPVSEIVTDAASGRPLYLSNADRPRPPASLAKLMTLLLVFDAMDAGRLRARDQVVMTAEGERQRPSRLGLARGHGIDLASALRAVAVISANDVAVALADRIAGSEARFVALMNRRAADIGMKQTRFGNATGLEPGAGVTTARDLATLSRYIIRRYPDRYGLFSTRAIRWENRTRPNHNQLLGKVKGLDGLKTGYTVPAGFNLAASSRRDGKRMIVVVMGARTAPARDLLVSNLLEAGFASPATRTRAKRAAGPVRS